jgi:hypothetical protein
VDKDFEKIPVAVCSRPALRNSGSLLHGMPQNA